jgi:hypothetical protein
VTAVEHVGAVVAELVLREEDEASGMVFAAGDEVSMGRSVDVV